MADASKSHQSVDQTYTITIEEKPKNIIVTYQADDKTLLNNLESNDIEVHYHCRDGFCGACRVTLKKGEIIYPNGEPLAFVGENEILPCCCIPNSDLTLQLE